MIKLLIKKAIKKLKKVSRFYYAYLRFFTTIKFNNNFINDSGFNFNNLIKKIKNNKFQGVVILGNSSHLNDLTHSQLASFKNKKYLIIGLNRSIYKYKSDILLWADYPAIYDIFKNKHYHLDCLYLNITTNRRKHFYENSTYWLHNKSFENWKYNRIFLLRTILTSALHLCLKINIKKIYILGLDLEKRTYFYENKKFNGSENYEIKSKDKIDANLAGYDTQKITKEVIEHLVSEKKFEIYSANKNNFLTTIEGLKFLPLDQINKLFN